MKTELRILFTAIMFYTRIPCPASTDHAPEYINKATRYFPFIGWIVGAISFTTYWLSAHLFDTHIAVTLSLLAGVMVTGAFHEDGLADVYDGFGGGWTKEKILTIMKDSRVGAYGVVVLIFSFALKYFALSNLVDQHQGNTFELFLFFISYHALARLTAVSIVFTESYAREDESSKAKPIAKAHTYKEVIGALVFGSIPLMALMYFYWVFAFVLIPLGLLRWYSARYFNKWIEGYTGDCLGAVEQIAELIILLSFIALWKFI
jgi:adenosylcobinamide-GDP ribazoletransferase